MKTLLVGRIVAVAEHPGARAPSYLVTVDLGGEGRREGTLPAGAHAPDELVGRQVVCELEPDGVALLTAHTHERGLVLIVPEHEVDDGTPVA